MIPQEYKALREKLGLTQAGLAALLGVTRKTVNSRETGAVRITEEAALAIRSLFAPNDQGMARKALPSPPCSALPEERGSDALR